MSRKGRSKFYGGRVLSIPTLLEISPSNLAQLDERVAHEHFFGKSLEEAIDLFRKTDHVYIEDLVWMGDIAFDFYVDAYIAYLVESPRDTVDICLAKGLVVAKVAMGDESDKLLDLVDAIERYGEPLEACDRGRDREYAEVKRMLLSSR
ncbi:hypothetical protein [Lysobacter sp. Root983]|uniref:hypothetical protein n=1 Tax=Lysobacter sp. Root983 TaxID=1736613 RepID=UPI0012FA09BD|nr:hypothetical protein [Lysobacter sp. Root983]